MAVKIIRRLTVGLLLVIGIPLLLGSLGTLIPDPFVYADDDAARTRHILVVYNTLHTDIAIPLDPESFAAFSFLVGTGPPILHPNARWLLIGWGGRSFYLETPTLADIKPGPTFRALTIDSSVMHVEVVGEITEGGPVEGFDISEAAYDNVLRAIAQSFFRRDGNIQPIDGYAFGTSDKFYEGEGSFNALLGCNTWTSRMLRSAGIVTGFWNPLPASLATSLRLFNHRT